MEYKRGQRLSGISASALNKTQEGVVDTRVRITGEPPIEVFNTGGGPRIRFTAALGFWAKLTSQDTVTMACAWTEQVFGPDGTFGDKEGGRFGTTTDSPAFPSGYSANPDSFLPVKTPTYVWLRPTWEHQPGDTPSGQEYEFELISAWAVIGIALEDLSPMCGATPGTGMVEVYQYDETNNLYFDTGISISVLNFLAETVPLGDWVNMEMEPFTGKYNVVGHHPDSCSSSSSSGESSTESESQSSSEPEGVCVVTDVSCDDGDLLLSRGKLTASVVINGITYPVTLMIDMDACGEGSTSGGA